jgi:broad specificity phosphatase PhoE
MLSFWWVRHAPVINNNDCCYGDNDVDCDTSDIKSFNNLVNNLPEKARVYSSTLSRAKKTFQETVALGYNYKEYFEDGRLKEQNIGEFAGMKYNELYELTKKLGIHSSFWLMEESYVPPKGESFTQLNERVKQFLYEKILEKLEGNIVIFSHGGPIRSAISIALGNQHVNVGPFKIDNLKVTKISYDNKKWQIDFINC